MQELETIKHLSNAYSSWNSKKYSLWEKLKKIVVEILIIVFAVMLSIWFHEKSILHHKEMEVKQFLLGLKVDLKKDISEMKEDKEGSLKERAAFHYLANVKPNQDVNADSLKKYQGSIFLKILLLPNDGRFEGFKSSGKMGDIDNLILQNDIMDLYQEQYKILQTVSGAYLGKKDMFFNYYIKNFKKSSDSVSNISAILTHRSEGRNICFFLEGPSEVEVYDLCISKAEKVVAEINAEYNLKD